jgi:hypothetical protein
MAVPQAISCDTVDVEFAEALQSASALGWRLERIEDLKVRALIEGPEVDGLPRETFIFEFGFQDYKEKPPYIEGVHPVTGERNQPGCFPTNTNGYFHQDRRICAEWNRGAYSELGGPHSDWQYANWMNNNEKCSTLTLMLFRIYTAIYHARYRGRGGK